jgi:hypothetical protein
MRARPHLQPQLPIHLRRGPLAPKQEVTTNKTVTRTVSNVGALQEASYTVTVDAPAGLDVKVTPTKLQFTKSVKKRWPSR